MVKHCSKTASNQSSKTASNQSSKTASNQNQKIKTALPQACARSDYSNIDTGISASNIYAVNSQQAYIQRKCDLCEEKQSALWQPKATLSVSAPDDPLEREADSAADKVMRMPLGNTVTAPALSRISGRRDASVNSAAQKDLLQQGSEGNESHIFAKKERLNITQTDDNFESSVKRQAFSGQRLPRPLRGFMENRFAQDFSPIRIHTGQEANRLASSVGARAFTLGRDIFFNHNAYSPNNPAGQHLIAHELAHTVQQGAAKKSGKTNSRDASEAKGPSLRSVSRRVSPGTFRVGHLSIFVNYADIAIIPASDYVSAIESHFIHFTGAPDASAIHAAITALPSPQQRWLLAAVDLLEDNTQSPLHNRLNRTLAVQRLISHAPNAAHGLIGVAGFAGEEEALRVAGWLEVALAANLTTATSADRDTIGEVLNPPPSGGVGAALDAVDFHTRMEPAVRHLINAVDPINFGSVGTRNLPTLQGIGDIIMNEARSFFSPFTHTSRTTVFGLNPPFHISPNIFSVTTLTPSAGQRRGYLRNRSNIVGRNTQVRSIFSDTNIFRDVNFDGSRAVDRAELNTLIATLLANSAVAASVDRLLQHTGRQSGSGAGTRIGLSTEFDSSRRNECEARWQVITTLCHEVLHALAHPDFEAKAGTVSFGQVLIEGFTEVLGVQLFNQRVKPKAAADVTFKRSMENGLPSAPCGAPRNATIGYGAAGAGAERILNLPTVGNRKFRAAYFLGQTHLLDI